MKTLLFLLFPICVVAQPKKGLLYSRKSAHVLQDNMVVWNREEQVNGKFFIGNRTLTIGNDQFSIDSANTLAQENTTIYTYFISLRGKQARCYVYPTETADEWGLLLDNNTSMILYKLRE